MSKKPQVVFLLLAFGITTAPSGGPTVSPNLQEVIPSDGRISLGVGRGLWAPDYGVKCDGVSDDVAAIAVAITAAITAEIVAVDFPAGICIIPSTITLGNGTTVALSTINTIVLRGVPQPFVRVNLASSLGTTGTIFKWTGAAGGTMARIVGPAAGLAFQNIAFDANVLAGTCLEIISARRAQMPGLSCANYTGTGLSLTTQAAYTGLGDNSQFGIEGLSFDNYQTITSTVGTTAINLDGYPDAGGGNTGYDTTRVSFRNTLISVPSSGASVGIRAAYADQIGFHDTIMFSNGANDNTSLAVKYIPTTTAASGRFPQNIVFSGYTDFGQNLGFDAGNLSGGVWPFLGGGHVAENITSFDSQVTPRDPVTRFLRFRSVNSGNPPIGGKWYEGGQNIAERHFRNQLVNSSFSQYSATSWASPISGSILTDNWIVQYNGVMAAQTFDLVALSADPTGYAQPFEGTRYLKIPLGNQTGGTFYNVAQRIPRIRGGAALYAGHKASFSFWMTGNGCTGTAGVQVTQNFGTGGSPSAEVTTAGAATVALPAGGWKRHAMLINVPSTAAKTFGSNNDDYLEIALKLPVNEVTICSWQYTLPQFEEGPIDTAYELRPQITDDLIAGTITSLVGTTGSIGGGALLAGACASGTVAVPGSTVAMSVVATPVTYPGDGNVWNGYVSTNGTVTVKVCAIIAATPTAGNYNVRVIQ